MGRKRARKNGRSHWGKLSAELSDNHRHELSPGLRRAVNRVLNDPLPEETARRALDALRRQMIGYARKSESRFLSRTMPVVAASVAWIGLAAGLWFAQTAPGRAVELPIPTTGLEMATAFADDLPTVWAYSKAARQSPEAFYAMLDHHAHQSNSGSWLLAVTDISPLVPVKSNAP